MIKENYLKWPPEKQRAFREYLGYLRDASPTRTNESAASTVKTSSKTVQRIINGKASQKTVLEKGDDLLQYFSKVVNEGVDVDDFNTWLAKRELAVKDGQEDLSESETATHRNSSRPRLFWLIGAFTIAIVALIAMQQAYLVPNSSSKTPTEVAEPEVKIDRPVYAQDIAAALENADIEALKDMTSHGVTIDRFETAFQTSAEAFFEKSKSNDPTAEWLASLIASGFDPETRTKHARYAEVSLVYSAFVAGNIEAVKALLSGGASPHAYQDILGVRKPDPFFLFPAHAVSKAEHITELEKIGLLDAMFDHGVAFYEPEKTTSAQNGDSTWIVSKDELPNLFRLTNERPRPVIKGCEFKRSRTRCLQATTATGENWCSVMDRVPSVIFVEDYHQFRRKLISIEVQDLISVSNGSAYFFATHLNGSQGVYGILEATPDEDIYSFLSYGRPFRQSHICEFDDDNDTSSWCWRDTTIRKTSETTGTIFDRINVKLFPTC